MSDVKNELLKEIGERTFNPQETLRVLKMNFWTRMASWGAHAFTVTELDEYKETKILYFKVQGHHHKGWVVITLAWDDTYTVRIVNNQWRVIDTYTMVYVDGLVELIDDRVERIADYVR